MRSTYLIGLGSNKRHHRYGVPRAVLIAAVQKLATYGDVKAVSPIIKSDPIGPAQRRFANAVCILECAMDPPTLLAALKEIEQVFGRRRGMVWGDRVLDLDILLWTGGRHNSVGLTIPHRELRRRKFVLGPATRIAPHWRDPISGRTVRQLAGRASKR